MKDNIAAAVSIGIIALVVGLVIWDATRPSASTPPLEQPECLELSRDGSYCFRQPFN